MTSAVVPEPPPPSTPPPSTPSFDFLRPFTFVFDDPQWIPKVLVGGLFVLASFVIIGIFFIFGYVARLTRNVIESVPSPLPEWDDLGDYFSEGLKLFAVSVLYVLPIALLAAIAVVPAAILSGGDNEALRTFGGLSATCVWCLFFPLSLAFALWMPAALLRVVVTGQFSAGFEFSRIWEFIRANLGNYLLAFVAWLVARFAAGLGIFLLCIGIIFTMFWAYCVAGYAFGQCYRLATRR